MRHLPVAALQVRAVAEVSSVRPTPTDEEMAAIAAAVQATVLRPTLVVAAEDEQNRSPMWRFSGRWWSRPVAVRRYRPWT